MFRVAYLGNPDEPYSPVYLREAQRVARVLGLKSVFSIEVRTRADFDAAFATLRAQRPNALLVEPNGLNAANSGRISEFGLAIRLPTMHGSRDFVDAGGLISYGPALPVHFKRLAAYVDKVLKGARPADLPVEQPTKFELVINLKTAKALRLTIPQSLLLRADHIIDP